MKYIFRFGALYSYIATLVKKWSDKRALKRMTLTEFDTLYSEKDREFHKAYFRSLGIGIGLPKDISIDIGQSRTLGIADDNLSQYPDKKGFTAQEVELEFNKWCKATGRSGGVLVSGSIRQFFAHLATLKTHS